MEVWYIDRVLHCLEVYCSGFGGVMLFTPPPPKNLVNTIYHMHPFDFTGIPDLVADLWSLSSQQLVHNQQLKDNG